MKRLLTAIAGLLSLSIAAQAQVLPPDAADCYLDLIAAKALGATGKLIGFPRGRELDQTWQSYFVNTYTTLPDPYVAVHACQQLNNLVTIWPQMSSVERKNMQNMWKPTRGQEIEFIEPVFPDAAYALRIAYLKQLAEELRETPQTVAPSRTQDNSQAAIAELQRRMGNAAQLNGFNSIFYGR
jgi:hypothetical protein